MSAAGVTRRHVWLLAGGLLATGSLFHPASPLAAQSVRTPSGPWTLSRRLSRGLRDGKTITVKRAWRIRFAEQSRGIAIAGEQVDVSVDAPPNLAPLSQIERERSTEGMFPILLGVDGTIMAAGNTTSSGSFENAITTATALLEEGGFSQDSVKQQALYMAQLQKAGSSLLDRLPGDLFYPSTDPFREVRALPLPDGGSGEFEFRWQASVQDDTALLKHAQREVITRIGESERRSSEEWTLTSL